jgi:hypothetical protein
MDYVALPLLIFILGCVIHLEREVAHIKTIVTRNNKNPEVDSKKSKGRK